MLKHKREVIKRDEFTFFPFKTILCKLQQSENI